jgi:hypothetical protein
VNGDAALSWSAWTSNAACHADMACKHIAGASQRKIWTFFGTMFKVAHANTTRHKAVKLQRNFNRVGIRCFIPYGAQTNRT